MGENQRDTATGDHTRPEQPHESPQATNDTQNLQCTLSYLLGTMNAMQQQIAALSAAIPGMHQATSMVPLSFKTSAALWKENLESNKEFAASMRRLPRRLTDKTETAFTKIPPSRREGFISKINAAHTKHLEKRIGTVATMSWWFCSSLSTLAIFALVKFYDPEPLIRIMGYVGCAASIIMMGLSVGYAIYSLVVARKAYLADVHLIIADAEPTIGTYTIDCATVEPLQTGREPAPNASHIITQAESSNEAGMQTEHIEQQTKL